MMKSTLHHVLRRNVCFFTAYCHIKKLQIAQNNSKKWPIIYPRIFLHLISTKL